MTILECEVKITRLVCETTMATRADITTCRKTSCHVTTVLHAELSLIPPPPPIFNFLKFFFKSFLMPLCPCYLTCYAYTVYHHKCQKHVKSHKNSKHIINLKNKNENMNTRWSKHPLSHSGTTVYSSVCLSRMFSGRAERMCSHGTDEEELNSFIPVSAVSSCVLSFDVCLVVVMLGGSLPVNDVHSTSLICSFGTPQDIFVDLGETPTHLL